MDTPDLFPYREARRGQREFLRDARMAMKGGEVLLAQAPTGLGKTAVALAAALEEAIRTDRKVMFTTCRRSQHLIAVDTLRLIQRRHPVKVADIIARESMCTDHSNCGSSKSRIEGVARVLARQNLHVQELVELARRFNVCPYLTAQAVARLADVIICDYNYLFSPQSSRALQSLRLRLEDIFVLVDEAHNLPARTREALSASLTAEGLEAIVKALGSGTESEVLLSVSKVLKSEAWVVGGESRVPAHFLGRLLGRSRLASEEIPAAAEVEAVLRKAVSFLPLELRPVAESGALLLENWTRSDVLRLLSGRDGGALSLKALDPRPSTGPVFRRSPAALLMSGTLHPGSMYVDILGLPVERVAVRSYLPDFPEENRLLVLSKKVSSTYQERPKSYDVYAALIADLCRLIPGNVATYFPSYEVAREVGYRLQHNGTPKPLLWERRGQTKEEREGLLRCLESSKSEGGYLLLAVQGASLSEGVDYPGGMLSAVIVGGLALNPPDLEVEALRSFIARRFGRRKAYEYAYLFPALNRMVQAAGRCIRGPEDRGAVIILESRLLRPFYLDRLPRGFDPTPTEDVRIEVAGFFAVDPELEVLPG